jgi:hypothetical protein
VEGKVEETLELPKVGVDVSHSVGKIEEVWCKCGN